MILRKSFLVALLLSSLFFLKDTLIAQSNACYEPTQFCIDDPAPPGSQCYQGGSFWCTPCTIRTYRCVPNTVPDKTCPGCATTASGSPINLGNGNTYIIETDVQVPGLGGGLALTRTWNSMWPSSEMGSASGLFGLYWRSTYEERVFVDDDGFISYARSDGSFWSFGYSSTDTNGLFHYLPAAPANADAALVTGPSYWTVTFKNGEKRLFDNATGNLISIIDRNGNTTQLSYDSASRLVTVTDPASRHLYFSYGSGSSYLVTGITSDLGLTLSYIYDSQGRLTQVTKTDGTTLSFEYNSASLITAVKDSAGKILESHTYDSSSRGLTSSRANGVDSVTLSY